MKRVAVITLLTIGLLLTACSASAEKVDTSTITELQIDEDVQVANGDDEVEALSKTPEKHLPNHTSSMEMGDDMTLFTPEDVVLLDNIGNQDWLFEEDQSWLLRFDDDVLIIGQENGQVTDILRYHITSIDHDEQILIIHIIGRLNEHSKSSETEVAHNYYCQLQLNKDQLTYTNKMNDPIQMTETVWIRKK